MALIPPITIPKPTTTPPASTTPKPTIPVVTPIVEVIAPIVTPVVTPAVQVTAPVVEAVVPVVTPVVTPVVEAVKPVVEAIPEVKVETPVVSVDINKPPASTPTPPAVPQPQAEPAMGTVTLYAGATFKPNETTTEADIVGTYGSLQAAEDAFALGGYAWALICDRDDLSILVCYPPLQRQRCTWNDDMGPAMQPPHLDTGRTGVRLYGSSGPWKATVEASDYLGWFLSDDDAFAYWQSKGLAWGFTLRRSNGSPSIRFKSATSDAW